MAYLYRRLWWRHREREREKRTGQIHQKEVGRKREWLDTARLAVSTFYSKKPIGMKVNGLGARNGRPGGRVLMALGIHR